MNVANALPETPLAIDTDVFTWLRNNEPGIQSKVFEHFQVTKQYPSLTAITVLEARIGIEKARANGKITNDQSASLHAKIDSLVEIHNVLDFNSTAARIASHVVARLGNQKSNENWYDIMIVATALAHGYGVASGNPKDMNLIAAKLPDGLLLQLAVWRPGK